MFKYIPPLSVVLSLAVSLTSRFKISQSNFQFDLSWTTEMATCIVHRGDIDCHLLLPASGNIHADTRFGRGNGVFCRWLDDVCNSTNVRGDKRLTQRNRNSLLCGFQCRGDRMDSQLLVGDTGPRF
jgi:hypothetical protein